MNKSDHDYCLKWAKKIKAVNLLGGECSCCRNEDIFVLQFHHIENKVERISRLINASRWSYIEKELKKCILLCANCHSEFHTGEANDKRRSQLKKAMLDYKGVYSCEECGYEGKNFGSLDFHRVADKKFNINIESWGYKGGKEFSQKLTDELDVCSVICKNCHIIKNIRVERFESMKKDIYSRVETYKEKPKSYKERILKLASQGYRNVDICRELGCSKGTVSRYFKSS